MTFEDITVAQVKAYFGIDVTDTSKDARITAMFPIASSRIREYCRNDFRVNTIIDECPIVKGDKSMAFVEHRPVTVITSVRQNGILLVENTDFICFKKEGRFVSLLSDFESDPDKLLISYSGGEELTQDVIQVYYEIVGIYSTIRTRSYITNAGIENTVSLNSIPEEFTLILDLHRKARTL